MATYAAEVASASYSGPASGSATVGAAPIPSVNDTAVPVLPEGSPQQGYTINIYGDTYGLDNLEEQIVSALKNAEDRDLY